MEFNIKNKTLLEVWRYCKIVLGAAIYAVGFRKFLFPNSIMTGGITGISMIINRLFDLPVGMTTLVLNVPLFIMARKVRGKKFFIGSIVGMVCSSTFVDLFEKILPDFTRDPLLGTLYGGVIVGVGIGLVFSSGASTGGTGIIAGLLRKKFRGVNMGKFMRMLDVAVIVLYALIFRNFDPAMYSVLVIAVYTKVMDGVLYGFEYSKLTYIISDKQEEIKARIQTELDRSVTLLEAHGGYSGKDEKVILCAIKKQQIVRLKRIVQACDKNAFVIISDAREVLGNGFESFDRD